MDKIIIAASAAICGTVVVAVVIFICCNRKRSTKSEKLRLSNVLAATSAGGTVVHHNGGLSTTATSLAGSQVQSPLVGGNGGKDWDQLSMYSSRSIPRARMYHHGGGEGSVRPGSVNGGFIPDDARSHASGYSLNKSSGGVNLIRSRSLIDGQVPQTGRSVSALSGRGATYLPPGLHHQFSAAGMGLTGLNMAGLSGSMSTMAGLPTLSGLGLSRAGKQHLKKECSNKCHPNTTKKTLTTSATCPVSTTKTTNQRDRKSLSTSTTALLPEEASSSETLSSTTQA